MSKKSRKRNKKILAAIGIGLGAAALASRKPKKSGVSQDSGRGSGNRPTVDTAKKDTAKKDTATKSTGPVSTPTTVMDSMPPRRKLNEDSRRTNAKGETFTIKGAKAGDTKKVGNKKTTFVSDSGTLTKGGKTIEKKDTTPTALRNFFESPAKKSERVSVASGKANIEAGSRTPGMGLRSGGRANYKSGGSTGSSKASGCAIKGTSPILLKGKR